MFNLSLDKVKIKYVDCEYFDDISEDEFDAFYNMCEGFKKATYTVREIDSLLGGEGYSLDEFILQPQFNPNYDRDPWIELQLNLIDSEGRKCYIDFKINSYLGGY